MSDGSQASDPLAGLPGATIVRAGLADMQAGRRTAAAALIDVARERLARAGLVRADAPPPVREPERVLYSILLAEGGDAYSRYNALLNELDSFAAILERRRAQVAVRS